MKLCTNCNGHFEDKLEYCPNEGVPLIFIGNQPLIGIIVGGRYKVIQAVGAGSMGVVYKAIQISSGREMAVKVLTSTESSDSAHQRRFRREAKAVSSLSHENIVRLYDFGYMEDGQPYIVTEFVRGKTLAQILRERGRLSIAEVLPIARQTCNAVEEAHRVGVVHRDLKPENIILQDPDYAPGAVQKQGLDSKVVKVVDFGVAKIASESSSSASLTMEGKVCGSPGYMSPEQCKGFPVELTSDVYSLGIILFEILSGHRPFSADSVMGLLFMHVNEPPPFMNALCLDLSISSEIEQVIRRALSKEPRERQQSSLELWREFEAACHGKPKPVAAKPRPSDWIPFMGKEKLVMIEEEVQRKVHKKQSPALDSLDPEEFDLPDDEEAKDKQTFWLSRPIRLSLLLGALLLVVMTATGVLPSMVRLRDASTEVPDNLIAKGKLADALIAIDRLKKTHKFQTDDADQLNERYVQVADKYFQQKNYDAAVDTLQRVSTKSKYYVQANQLIGRCKKLSTE